MKSLFTILFALVLFTSVSANNNNTAKGCLSSDRFTPISVRTYYLETSQDVCSYADFLKAFKANHITTVDGYKLVNGTFYKSFKRVWKYTEQAPIKTVGSVVNRF